MAMKAATLAALLAVAFTLSSAEEPAEAELECPRATTATEWQVPATGVGADLGTGCWNIDGIDPCDLHTAEQPDKYNEENRCYAAKFAAETGFVASTVGEAVEWCKGIAKTTGRPGCCQMNHINSDFVRDDDGAQAYSEGQIMYLSYYFTHTVGGTPVTEAIKIVEGDDRFSVDPGVDIAFVAGLISCQDEPVTDAPATDASDDVDMSCCEGLQPNTAKCIACSNGMSLDAFCKANPESFIDECSNKSPTSSSTSVCPAVKDAYNVAVQTCLEVPDNDDNNNDCASSWTAYKASMNNKATDCVTDSTKTCHPGLASAAEMYTSGSPAAIDEAILDPSTEPEMSTVLACFKDSPDAPGCMMRELFEVDFNDESKSESFWASTTCDTNPDPPVPISQLLMPGFSCQPDACAKISACSLCKPTAPATTPEPVVGGCGGTQFGCCDDEVTGREDEAGTNCLEETTPATNGETDAGESGANPNVLETELSLKEALGQSAAGTVAASLGIALGAALLTTTCV
jgi:hypothetical protein